MQSLLRDVRYGMRSLLKSPGLSIVSVLALTLGIGLTTTMFSIVYGALMKGLPYPDGDRIMVVNRSNPARGITRSSLPIQDFVDYRAQQHVFTALAAFSSGTMYLSGEEKAERFDGTWISANAFDLLGVRPMIGRNFREGEDTPTGEKVLILSYTTWRERYNGDRAIVGKVVRMNGQPFTVVGVMPEGFAFPNNDNLWVPLQTDPLATKRGQGQFVQTFGRLKPGVSLDQASVELATIGKRLGAEYKENEGFIGITQKFTDNFIGKEPRQLLYTMLGAVFFVLLIACANVANLLLDRAAHRTKEVGIRTALGASRTAVVRQFLSESLVLSLAATGLGIVLAYFGVALFNNAIKITRVPFFIDIRLHPQVLLFTIVVAVLTTLISGAIPAYQSSRADINEVLKDDSRGASSFRIGRISKGLVIFEIALSCGLLVAAGLMIKSVTVMNTMDKGFKGENVFTARVGFPTAYTDTAAEWRFFDQVVERVGSLPGVQAASLSTGLPASQRAGFGGTNFAVEGQTYLQDKDYPNANWLSVTPKYFATLSTPLVSGRMFTESDRAGTPPVILVNRAFVAKFFKNGDPVGHRIRLGGSKSTAAWSTVIGVVGDQFTGDQQEPMRPVIYQAFAQARQSFVYISARGTGPAAALTQGVREIVSSFNPDIPLYWVQTLDEVAAQSLWFVRVFGTMFMIFGFVALFLASVGLYAVMSFSVSRRTREVGIRMALGAQGAHVVRMIFGQGLLQLAIGMGAGLALAAGISQLLKVVLFQVQPRDPVIFGGVALVLIAVGLLACFVPAKRATLVDPLVALRAD